MVRRLTEKKRTAAVIFGSALLALTIGGIVVYRRPGPVRSPAVERDAGSGRNPSLESVDASTVDIEPAMLRAGLSPSDAAAAGEAFAAYVAAMANRDFDRFAEIARTHGGEPNPVIVQHTRKILTAMPERVRPEGWRTWSDEQIVRYMLYPETTTVLKRVDWTGADATVVEGAEPLVDGFDYYAVGEISPGITAGIILSPFAINGLERRIQDGDARATIVTLSVTNQAGTREQISVLLGEYAPGKWFPVSHRRVLYGS